MTDMQHVLMKRCDLEIEDNSFNSILTCIHSMFAKIHSISGSGSSGKIDSILGSESVFNAVNFFISTIYGTEARHCSRSNKRTQCIIVQDTLKTLAIFTQVKPSPLKSLSTSAGMFIDGLPGRPPIDRRDK